MAAGSTLWDNEVILNQKGISFNDTNFSVSMGGREFNLRSWAITNIPASTLFIFDNRSLRLEKIKTYPFDKELQRATLSNELMQYKDKLAFVISRVGNLPGFADPRNNPERWAFFYGRPGSSSFTGGPITGNFFIPFELIQKLSKSEIEDSVVSTRRNILQTIKTNNSIRDER
ncbi:MAG: hypothetical protein JRF02_06405 [Deltaproteobacteria bacterium]|nr:hypothetical protein [Deltaproteobacteria bacterium]